MDSFDIQIARWGTRATVIALSERGKEHMLKTWGTVEVFIQRDVIEDVEKQIESAGLAVHIR